MKLLGSMIKHLRKEAGLTQLELCRKISSAPELSRIERGQKEPDNVLVSALVQRLGKSLEHFEITVTGSEYQIYLLKIKIQSAILKKKISKIERHLDCYETYSESKKPLHQQYILMVRAVINYMKYKSPESCIEMLREAITLSISAIPTLGSKQEVLCLQEVHLLALFALMCMEKGEDVTELLEVLVLYIEEHYTSETLKISSYPGCCYLLARAYECQGKIEAAYKTAQKGIAFLKEKGSMIFFKEFLLLLKRCDLPEHENIMIEKELEAIQYLKDYVRYQETEEIVLKILFSGASRRVVSGVELLKGAREAQGLSQEKLSRDICARETISNIENGRTPNLKKLHVLLDRLGVNRSKYFCYVTAENFETYEILQRFLRNLMWENNEEVTIWYKELKDALNTEIPLNWQFLHTMSSIHKKQCKKLMIEDTIYQLETGLRYTMPEYDGVVHRIPYREELAILNYLALCLWETGKEENAIRIFDSVRVLYMQKKEMAVRHVEYLLIFYYNYIECLSKYAYPKEALRYGREALRLAVQCQQGYLAARLLQILSDVYEKQGTEEKNQEGELCSQYAKELLTIYQKNS